MNTQLVRNWMTPNPIAVNQSTTLPEVQRLLTEHHIRRLPVVDGNKLVGIVTLGDVREARPSDATSLSVYELNYLLDKLTVKDFMTRNPIAISPNATIRQAALLMLEHKIGGLPVIEGNVLVGIITETDFCRLLISQPELDS